MCACKALFSHGQLLLHSQRRCAALGMGNPAGLFCHAHRRDAAMGVTGENAASRRFTVFTQATLNHLCPAPLCGAGRGMGKTIEAIQFQFNFRLSTSKSTTSAPSASAILNSTSSVKLYARLGASITLSSDRLIPASSASIVCIIFFNLRFILISMLSRKKRFRFFSVIAFPTFHCSPISFYLFFYLYNTMQVVFSQAEICYYKQHICYTLPWRKTNTRLFHKTAVLDKTADA